jgi:thymidylate synthase ThyX
MTIKATIIQDSWANGVRIVTFELEYQRFIHAELMTHRLFSRNAASSRAVPIEKMLAHILESPAEPVHWGANQAGMSAKAELSGQALSDVKAWWSAAKDSAVEWSRILSEKGLHKQIANRVTEPFQIMKTIVTTTELDNWFALREHEDAQPEIHALATAMREAMEASEPMALLPEEWHVPYVTRKPDSHIMHYLDANGSELTLQEAIMISGSCCAQVSYRKSDDTLEKAKLVYQRLVGSVPRHSSPFEHQARPMECSTIDWADAGWKSWDDGVTHVDSQGSFWSGNFRGWVQNRQLIDQEG